MSNNTHAFSPAYDAALALAARAHRDQLRKGTDIPYIAHAVHVSLILIRHGFGEELAAAGLLHDVVEDSGVPIEQVRAQFGEAVARLVDAVSEQKRDGEAELPWEERKAHSLARLRAEGADVAALKAADAIHNARTTSADLRAAGASVWARFKRGPEPTIRYYRAILEIARARLGDHAIVEELADAVAELEQLAGTGAGNT